MSITIKETKPIEVDNLFLDPENPRLAKSGDITDDKELLKEISRRYDIKDLLSSFSQHGYFTEEPLIGVPKDSKEISTAKKFVIVEGNRRLAALKILLSKENQELVGAKKIPTFDKKIRAKLNPVPVKVYPSREDIIPYLGVRHITGIKPWDALAKAKYVQKLVEDRIPIKEVTKIVSSRSDVVNRSLLTLYVINQANEIADESWEEEARSFKFSLLYTAIGYVSIRKYLGIDLATLENPKPSPVLEDKKDELLYVMSDLYGTPDKKKSPRVAESRDIKELAAVYSNKESLDDFRGGASLNQAFRKSGGEKEQLKELLREAGVKLNEASGIAPHHKGDTDALNLSKRCYDSAEHLMTTLKEKV